MHLERTTSDLTISVTPTNNPMYAILPLQLQHVLNEIRQLTHADDALIVNSMLSAMSVAVQASTDIIHPFTHEAIPLSLYCITVAGSGSRKSTVDKIFMKPFHDFEREQEKENGKLDEIYEADKEAYDARLKSLKSKLKKANDNDNLDDQEKHKADIAAHIKTKPTLAPKIRVLVNDTSQAKLQIELGKPWNKVCLNTDEAGQIINSRNFTLPSYYNALWDAKPQTVERIDGESRQARDYRFSMNLMLQPTPFSKYIRLHGQDAKETGFFARCLFSFPLPFYQTQPSTIARVKTPHLDSFVARIAALLNFANNKFRCNKFNDHRVLTIKDQQIISDFESWRNTTLTHQTPQNPEFTLRATEHALRLAGVMHAFLCDDNDHVEETILSAAFKMTCEFAYQYQQAVNYNELSDTLIDDLLDFIHHNVRYNPTLNKNVVNKTTLLQKGPTKLRKKEQLDLALDILEGSDKIRRLRFQNGHYITTDFYLMKPPFYNVL